MSEVSRRDAQATKVCKIVAWINENCGKRTITDVEAMRTELDKSVTKYQELHDLVMQRAGLTEQDHQDQIANDILELSTTAFEKFDNEIHRLKQQPPQKPKEHVLSTATNDPRNGKLLPIVMLIRSAERQATNVNDTMGRISAEQQLCNLKSLYSQYQAELINALAVASDLEQQQLIEDEGRVSQSYWRTSASLQTIVNVNTNPGVINHPVPQNDLEDLRIPAVQIGTFDGNPTKWESFRESFEHVYNNRRAMPDVQKLQQLKSCLRGEAEELIANFSLTNENYQAAWTLVKQRYDNPYELTRAHLRILTTMTTCKENATDIRRLLNRTSSSMLALKNLGRPVQHWDDWIVYLVVEKFDQETRRMWENKNCTGTEFPKWTELEQFLENRVRALNAIGVLKKPQPAIGVNNNRIRTHAVTAHSPSLTEIICPACPENHAIYMCHAFRQLSPNERRELVADKKLCFICLSSIHMSTQCRSERRCRFCDQSHNSLLHMEDDNDYKDEPQVINSNSLIGSSPSTVLLATAIVRARAHNGDIQELRVFFDNGSQTSFISEHAAQLLKLPRRPTEFDMTGVGGSSCGKATQAVTVTVTSRINDFTMSVDALVLRRVTRPCSLPPNIYQNWSHLNGLELADPDYQHPKRIDMLIGAEMFGWSLLPELRKAEQDAPVAQNSQFGWIISGSTKATKPLTEKHSSTNVNHATINNRIDDCLERFWHIENIEQTRAKTVEEVECETQFHATVMRDTTGRFHVRIPFRKPRPRFGDSLQMAARRQYQMERKFASNPSFALEYCKFMSQYRELGHMELIGTMSLPIHTQQVSEYEYYIPHHAVLKESSSTTKLRVVFDASRRTSNGHSLNEQMLPGPRLQDDLSMLVMRWRKYKVVFTADVERMYRQIVIDDPDANYQRIVWRSSPNEPMQIFKLRTVTYGTTSAPYLAIKALQTLAEEEKERFPIAAKIAKQDFYVDDVLTGFDDVQTALVGQRQLRRMMNAGGFELKKWISNYSELLDHLPDGYCECRIPLQFHLDQFVKTLGIQWHPVSDQMSFKISFDTNTISVTKRQFLSDAARLYDPLGWLAPSVVMVKILFQKLWQSKIDWDECIPEKLYKQWNELRQSFHTIQDLRIGRWIGSTSSSVIELHGFCDASTQAYAAAVYTRITKANGDISVHLLCAKTKVAPLKTLSLPRLELCGANMLCRLMQNVLESMNFDKVTVHCWTDSTIVLAWIKAPAARWSVFVANRVAEIQRNFPIHHWQHVISEENPADCASRGVLPSQLASHTIWWTGPQWLSTPSEWPNQTEVSDTNEEIRTKSVVIHTTLTPSWELKVKYSSWNRLIRITAYCIRFIQNARRRSTRCTGYLRPDELQAARIFWIKDAQHSHFEDDIRRLRENLPIHRSSPLRSLNPTFHSDGLIHVGSRLINALVMPEQTRTPVIIPRRCRIAELLVQHAHEQTLHGGPSLMLAYLRRQYWVIDGPKQVRQFVKSCNRCFRFTSTLGQQMMAALPSARTTPSKPFAHTAMDYSGAVMLRSSKGRGQHATKGYVSVFVCLSTKAVHIEVVSDLTSVAFIAAYKRFTGRRGICSDLYSDNATNYVGAAAIFSKTERELGFTNEVSSTLAMMGTTWHFSPPLAPHFNGLAESAIRSVKHHVRRIIGESTLTYEEMTTFLIQVECCLNSRPLYPLSSDPTDYVALTPAHFLVGTALNAVPERSLLNSNPNLLTRWQLVQMMVQRFWTQWSTEYLHTLHQRKKWQIEKPNYAVGDMVIIKDENRSPSSWPLGRITEVHPGKDGHVRVVTIRTATSTMKRSVVKLARLPSQN